MEPTEKKHAPSVGTASISHRFKSASSIISMPGYRIYAFSCNKLGPDQPGAVELIVSGFEISQCDIKVHHLSTDEFRTDVKGC